MPRDNSDASLSRSAFLKRAFAGMLVGGTLIVTSACGMEDDDDDDEDDDEDEI